MAKHRRPLLGLVASLSCQARCNICKSVSYRPANILKYVWEQFQLLYKASVLSNLFLQFVPSAFCCKFVPRPVSRLSIQAFHIQMFCIFLSFIHYASGAQRPAELKHFSVAQNGTMIDQARPRQIAGKTEKQPRCLPDSLFWEVLKCREALALFRRTCPQ